MSAPASALIAGRVAAEESAGAVKKILEALNEKVVSLKWEKNPKTHKMELVSVQVNVTTGLVLGGAGLALAWEAANWFARAGVGGATNPMNVIAAEDMLAGPGGWIDLAITDIFGNAIKTETGAPKTVQAPPSFGAAYNVMLRNFVVAGPGTIAAELVSFVGNLTTGGGPGSSGGSQSFASSGAQSVWDKLKSETVDKGRRNVGPAHSRT